MDLFTIFLGIAALIMLLVYLMKKRYAFWKNLNAPFVDPVLILGNLNGIGKDEHIMTRFNRYYKEYKATYPFVGLFFLLKPVALLIDLDLIKQVMIKDFHNFHDRAVYSNEKDDPVSAHLFAIYGPKWKLLRHKLTPTFTSGKMKFMFSTIIEVSGRLENKIKDISKNQSDVEIKDVLARYTTDVIGSCAFGIESNTLNDGNAEFRKIGVRIFDDPKFNFATTLMLTSMRPLAQKLGIRSLRKDVTDFIKQITKETIDFRYKNQVHRNDFIDLLIELQKNPPPGTDALTLNEIAAQSFVFFAAGFETSSTLLTFCLYELSKNPDIQDKTRNHIEDILARHNGEFTYEAMTNMKYVDQVLNETLRMYPPLSSLFRVVDQDYQIPGTKYMFKSGTLLAIPVYAIQRDPEIYPNPSCFDPEHFSDENTKARHSMAFLPFGEGPRNCIGLRFGMMQARVGLVAALRKFQYSLSEKLEQPINISKNRFITSPEGGMWLKVKAI